MTERILPTPEQLRELLRYEPETGKLFWLQRDRRWFKTKLSHTTWNTRFAGKMAFTATGRDGYMGGTVLSIRMAAHRVAWAVYWGVWPQGYLDHINCEKTDNRLSNLRCATLEQNSRNKKKHKDNESGFKGVHLDRTTGKWRAQIMVNGKRLQLGSHPLPEDAHAAYRKAADDLHGEFARH